MELSPSTISSNSQEVDSAAFTTSISDQHSPGSAKPKQKRNKPTLSCIPCVSHKTKCDRGRPQCLACLKRSSECEYSSIANVLATSDVKRVKRRASSKTTSVDSSADKCSIDHIIHPRARESPTHLPVDVAITNIAIAHDTIAHDTIAHDPIAHDAIAHDEPIGGSWTTRRSVLASVDPLTFTVFGNGKAHPFANYWTSRGGLAEVVDVLPSKRQADILTAKYFDVVDPCYPILGDRKAWLLEYERFWSLSPQEQAGVNGSTVALHFAVYGLGTQFIDLSSQAERTKTAEFYLSAAHQALKLDGYLHRMTMTTVQCMVLIFYFLVNDNHISDAFTFSGITQRQACVLQLHRDPSIILRHTAARQKNSRVMLWASMVLQETWLAMQLKLPSTSVHSDVGPHSLIYLDAGAINGSMGQADAFSVGDIAIPLLDAHLSNADVAFAKSCLAYASFCQDNICRAGALGLPICRSNEHRTEMLLAARSLYRSFPNPFGSYNPKRYMDPHRRIARQQIKLCHLFFHGVMCICADENPQADVVPDFFGTLEAGHEALGAFFALNDRFGDETANLWTYLLKAFEEAMVVAKLLAADQKPMFPPSISNGVPQEYTVVVAAKNDLRRLLEFLQQNSAKSEIHEIQERRYETLEALYNRITVV